MRRARRRSPRRRRRRASRAGAGRSGRRPSCRRPPPRAARAAPRGSHRSGGAEPVRTSSGWWSNVITIGRASRREASATRCREQVRVAQVQPVEHADDDEHGLRPSAAGPRGRARRASRQAVVDAGHGGRSRRALGEHLVRVERARHGATHGRDPAVRAHGEHERRVADGSDRLGAVIRPSRSRRTSSSVIVGVGQVLQAGVDRAQDPRDARRAVGRVLAERLERDGVLEPEPARRGPHQRAEVGAASRAASRGPGPARGCTSRPSTRRPRWRSAARGRCRPTRGASARGSRRRAPARSTASPRRASW